MMPEFHSTLEFEMRRLDGRLFFLDSDDLIRISCGFGVEGGVVKISTSGDGSVKAEGMVRVTNKATNVCGLVYAYELLLVWTPRLRSHVMTFTADRLCI